MLIISEHIRAFENETTWNLILWAYVNPEIGNILYHCKNTTVYNIS